MEKNRLWFLQAARGIACLIIVCMHWSLLALDPDRFSGFIYQTPISPTLYAPPTLVVQLVALVNRVLPGNYHASFFGLGLFFLISGFVIPLSMDGGSQVAFLVRRFLRIYPVVFATMLAALAVICFGRWLEGIATSPIPFYGIMANVFLVRDVLQYQFIDNGLWTLEVEMHFYLLCFFLGFFNGHKKALVILITASLLCVASFYAGNPIFTNTQTGVYLNVLGMNACFITLMLVGVALYNHSFNRWSSLKTISTITLLMMANKFCLTSYQQFASGIGEIMYSNHIYAMGVFLLLLAAGPRLPYFKWLDRLAEVSYPLYLIHGAATYTVYFVVFKAVSSSLIAALASILFTMIMTWLIHTKVERKGIELSKWMCRVRSKPIAA